MDAPLPSSPLIWQTHQFTQNLFSNAESRVVTDWICRGFAEALPPEPLQRASRLSPRVQAASQTVLRREDTAIVILSSSVDSGKQAAGKKERSKRISHQGRADVELPIFSRFLFAIECNIHLKQGQMQHNRGLFLANDCLPYSKEERFVATHFYMSTNFLLKITLCCDA